MDSTARTSFARVNFQTVNAPADPAGHAALRVGGNVHVCVDVLLFDNSFLLAPSASQSRGARPAATIAKLCRAKRSALARQCHVLVHKFVSRETIEERIDALIDEKRQPAADLLEGGAEKTLTEMSDTELIRFA